MSNSIQYLAMISYVCIAIVYVANLISGLMSSHTLAFGVRLPASAKLSSAVQRIVAEFVIAHIIAGMCSCAVIYYGVQEQNIPLITAVILSSVVVIALLNIAAYKRMRALKKRSNWSFDTEIATVAYLESKPIKQISRWWQSLYVIEVAVAALLAYTLLDNVPDAVVTHVDAQGNPIEFNTAAYAFCFYVFLSVLLAVSFYIAHVIMHRSKRGQADPSRPVASELAYQSYMRINDISMLIVGLLSGLWPIVLILQTANVIARDAATILICICSLTPAIIIIVVQAFVGQNGSRLIAASTATSTPLPDDDDNWILGSIYNNPNDPSIFVPKRFGIGYTINFGQWQGRLAIVLVILIPLVLVLCIAAAS